MFDDLEQFVTAHRPCGLEKVDNQGNVLGFSVQKVSAIRTQPSDGTA